MDSKWLLVRRAVFALGAWACLFFFVASALAMLVYPGGTMIDPGVSGYSFLQNFFSDLGRTHGFDQRPQWLSWTLFTAGLTFLGVAMMAVFALYPTMFSRRPAARAFARSGALGGVVAGAAYLGIAWTPFDLYPHQHLAFVYLAFVASLVVVALLIPAIFLEPDYPNRYGWLFTGLAAVLLVYLFILFLGPKPTDPEALVLQASAQKIVVYGEILIMGLQCLGAFRLTARETEREEPLNEQPAEG